MIHDNHLYTAIGFKDFPTLYRIAKAKQLIRDAESSISVIEKWNTGGVFFESKEQHERIAKYRKMIERLRNYVRNQCIILITQS